MKNLFSLYNLNTVIYLDAAIVCILYALLFMLTSTPVKIPIKIRML